jgi:N-acyl-D-aspartate/D-glutamate deacylase
MSSDQKKPKVRPPRDPGGVSGDKMRRAASELRDAADEILETAASLDEGAERLNTLETIVRLKGRDMISRVERLEKQMAEVLKFVKKLSTTK